MLLLCALLTVRAEGAETRRSYDALGKPVDELVLDDGVLVSETTWTYEGGHPVLERRSAGGVITEIARRYEGDTLVEETTSVDGQLSARTTWKYEGDRLVEEVAIGPAGSQTTTYRYDSLGRLIATEVRDGSGAVVQRSLGSYAPPAVPIVISATGGGSYASDVAVTSLTGGFLIERSPESALYDVDPLEFSVGASYAYGRSADLVTQNQLDARFGIDLNHLIGQLTLFLFTTLERDPVANLNLDLVVAPIGLKHDLFDTPHFALDASFAPVWNYRSIESEGSDCDGVEIEGSLTCGSSKLRGSFRVKASASAGPVSLSDTLEYLPNLLPEDRDLIGALSDDSILINTAALSIKLSSSLSLSESFVFERDPTLAAQADCGADPDNLLCDGLLYSTATTLSYSQSF